jgi:hypothetical protein
MSTIITSGDDLAIPITLNLDGVAYAIDLSSVVRGAVIHIDDCIIVSGPVTLDNAATGADWPNGLIILEMTSAQSAPLAPYHGKVLQIEIEVDDPTTGKRTWRVPDITIQKGLIS